MSQNKLPSQIWVQNPSSNLLNLEPMLSRIIEWIQWFYQILKYIYWCGRSIDFPLYGLHRNISIVVESIKGKNYGKQLSYKEFTFLFLSIRKNIFRSKVSIRFVLLILAMGRYSLWAVHNLWIWHQYNRLGESLMFLSCLLPCDILDFSKLCN